MEMGLTYLKLNQYSEAKNWVEKSKNNYKGFLAAAMIQIRAHLALKRIKKCLEIESLVDEEMD